MKRFLKENWLIISLWAISMLIAVFLFKYYGKDQRLGSGAIACSTITLIFITWFYAKQTEKLVEEQRMERDLQFNERRLHTFYNPFIFVFYEAIKDFGTMSLKQTDELLGRAYKDLYSRYSYMMSKDSAMKILALFNDIGIAAIVDANKKLSDEEKEEFLKELYELTKILNEERKRIEDYISANYRFPENVDRNEGEKGNINEGHR